MRTTITALLLTVVLTGTARAWPRPTPTPTPIRYDAGEVFPFIELSSWRYEIDGGNVIVTASYRNHSNLCVVGPSAVIRAAHGPDGDSAYVDHAAALIPASIGAHQTGEIRAEFEWSGWRLGRSAFGYIHYQGWEPCATLMIAPLPPGEPGGPLIP